MVELKGNKFKLPFKWWVSSENSTQIGLNRISMRKKFFGPIFVTKRYLSKETLQNFRKQRELNETQLVLNGGVKDLSEDNEEIYGIEYIVKPENGQLYWTLSLPSKELVIDAFEIYPEDKKIIFDEIIKGVVIPSK